MKNVVLLGSTGSIGTSTVKVAEDCRTASGWSAWPPETMRTVAQTGAQTPA